MPVIITTVSISEKALQILISEQASKNAFNDACRRLANKRRELNKAQRECHEAEQEVIRLAKELADAGLSASIQID